MSELIDYTSPIPDGWEIMNFNETYSSVTLNKIKIKQKDYLVNGNFPVIDQGQELIGGYFDDIKYLIDEEPPFVVFGDHTKVKKFINFKFVAGADGVKVLKPNSHINSKLLFYFLHCFKIPDRGYARHFQFLNNAEFPLPPLAEQQRIVAKIEELFSELDKGIETLKTAQQQLKIYRQAVLKYAFEGKLTNLFRIKFPELDGKTELGIIRKNREEWFKVKGKKLKLDNKVDDYYLNSLPDNWQWIKIVETVFNTADDIVDGPFGSNLKNSDYVENAPVPVISISNIEEGFDKKIRHITYEKFETIKRSAVYPGDVIVAKIGSTYGKTGVYPESMPIGVIPANLLRIRPSGHFRKKLLVYYLQSAIFKKRLDNIMKSTAQPAFNVSMFKDLPIPFMHPKEQDALIDEIESRLSVCDKIEESIEQGLQQAEALRQSILKKAFEGKLVPQDPNDEPASVLLERIKAERAAAQPEKKSRTKKVKA
jgi:type I restriction enzyme S subunit